ncbi:MAG: hypothetical protein PCFJNLEI_00865 [Verrucomicrobiae bacterium]|nr:hypothetical protein [Verrucomicrobiae bacterium]
MNIAPWLVLLASATGVVAGEPVVEAELHTHLTDAFVNPQTATGLPRVLIIGDSISIGYTAPVRLELKGIADVFRPNENCQHSGYVLAKLNAWLGGKKWDVIHFNCGIWDTHFLDAKGNLVRADDQILPPGVRIRHTPEQYRENLIKIVTRLQRTGAKLIWASTTPVMRRKGERFEAIPTLNRVAAEVMQTNGVVVNDLYDYVLPHVKEWQSPDQAHFNDKGNAELGKRVAQSIQQALPQRKN